MGSGESGEKGQPNNMYGGLNSQNDPTRTGRDGGMRQTGNLAGAAVAGGAAGALAGGATRDRRGDLARGMSGDANREYTNTGDAGVMPTQVGNDGIERGPPSGAAIGAAAGTPGREGDDLYDHENICHRCGHSLEDCNCEEGPLYYYQVTLDRLRSRSYGPS